MSKIKHTILEQYSQENRFHLKDLTYDLPFDLESTANLEIEITVPKNHTVYLIDDLKFSKTTLCNTIKINLHENSSMFYLLYVANHQLCNLCPGKTKFACQKLPTKFEKRIIFNLLENEATSEIKCHYLGDSISEFHLETIQHHQAPKTSSKSTIKGVLDNKAKLISKNKIVVDKGLSDVVAEQQHNNLILNKNARAISIPQLQIETKNVSCKHGVTMKSIDSEELFYLESRGIPKEEAEHMLIKAFLK